MPWVSGAFHRLYSWVADAAAGQDISSSRMDQDTNDIVGGLNLTLLQDGSTHPVANLPMNGFHHTGASPAAAPGQYLTWDQFAAGTLPPMPALPGNVAIGGTLNVTGATTLGALTAGATTLGATTISGLNNTGNASIGGTLNVAGGASLAGLTAGNSTFNGNVTLSGTAGLTVGGNLVADAITANTHLYTNQLTASGASEIVGALTCDSNVTLTGTAALNVGGNIAAQNITANNAVYTNQLSASGNISSNGTVSAAAFNTGGTLTASNLQTTTMDASGLCSLQTVNVATLIFYPSSTVLSSTAPPAGARYLYL